MGVSLGEGQGTEISRVPAITERFDVLRVLGRGAAGAVYLVRDKRSGDFGYGWRLDVANVRVNRRGVPGSDASAHGQ